MLEQLSISNLGIIERANLQLKSGLVVITGETGAGKTLFLDAIRALSGAKPDIVNTFSHQTASIDCTLLISKSMQPFLDEVSALIEEGAVSISRIFPKDARSKAILGGRTLPAGSLDEFSRDWLAIHGQHDSYRLMKVQSHRELLDKFGGKEIEHLLGAHRNNFHEWLRLRDQLNLFRKQRDSLMKEAESFKADLALCDSLVLRDGEDVEIGMTIERLSRVEQVRAAIDAAEYSIASDDSDVTKAVSAAEKALRSSLADDPQAQALSERLHSVSNELQDILTELSQIRDSLEIDPAELDQLMLRQRQIRTLTMRHGPQISDVIAWMEETRTKLNLIDPDGSALKDLENQVEASHQKAIQSASELSNSRQKLAAQLAARVQDELRELALPFAQFDVVTSITELGEYGSDRVEFHFSANPGLPLQPIEKAASGGELSRLMLAIEVVLSDAAPPAVMVFDEVDAGVAGAAAIAVGQRLAKLGTRTQVLVVTHLAQIAAFANQHFTVSKTSEAQTTQTVITELDSEQRISELARMLAGLESSSSAQQHAQELLEMAENRL